MRLSLLASFVALLVLVMVVVMATAFPSPREPRQAAGDKQPAQDRPIARRREPRRKGRPSQPSRQGKNYFGQQYNLGHGGVAFLMTGEVEVMKQPEVELEPNIEIDRCFGCCDVNVTDNPELQGTERGDGDWISAQTNKNVTFMVGVDVPDLVGGEAFFIDDQCLGCCIIVSVTPGPEHENGTETSVLPALNGHPKPETTKEKDGNLNPPTQQKGKRKSPYLHLDYRTFGRSSSESSSEEDGAVDGARIQELMKNGQNRPSRQGGRRMQSHSSRSSSSEESLAAVLTRRRDKLSRRG
ncbi:uncharacterized protein LOC115086016 isoform X2 [Rhinatrema bivittatum]|uniref:uncharacterized protein LOC115086016 isoform X2 n=1 Tax=Rhinatrema bivittatum TaxID=194408 RepID=UPI001127149B|nr:uncharacterized protein LOC115086016 isoform X2 [Rhinatrema bivittatum]